jgi:REP element-mobilizing transposase RayT
MPRNRRLFLHNHVYSITFRALSGLPLPPNAVVREVLKSCMARAQELYPVGLGDALVMSNHVHAMTLAQDPADVDRFVRHFKTESAHAINRMMGKARGKVWEDGYDAPVVLDINKYIEMAAYFLSNPQQAGLVSTIEEYPHLSSWRGLNEKSPSFSCLRLNRRDVPELPQGIVEKRVAKRSRAALKKRCRKRKQLQLCFHHYAIFQALSRTDTDDTFEEFRERILKRVREIEGECRKKRIEQRFGVLGRDALITASLHREHQPKSHGKRMLCLGSSIEDRRQYIKTYRAWAKACRRVFRSWQEGVKELMFPPGFYPPGGGRPTASLVPAAFWR